MNKFIRTIDARAKKGDGDIIEMAISSETPVERYFGIEVLSHEPGAVDLSRLSDGRHPLLVNHNTDDQVGVIKSARLDPDKVVRTSNKFSKSARGQEIKQDVLDDIRTMVSVGYEILDVIEVKKIDGEEVKRAMTGEQFMREMREEFGENFYRAAPAAQRAKGTEPPTYIVSRWRPFENSLVAIPADAAVGVGRSAAPVEPEATTQERDESSEQLNENEQRAEDVATSETQKIEVTAMSEEKKQAPPDQEAARRDGIIALGEQFEKYVGQRDINDALRNGRTVEQFKDVIMAKMESRHTDTSEAHIGMTEKEAKRYSFGRALQAAVTGNWSKAGFELECSRAVEKIVGQSPEGFYVPFDVFRRDFNVGTSTEAGNLVPNEFRGDMFVDALRNKMVLGQMGARILAGLTSNLDLPRKSTASTLGMVTEIGSASETNPLTALVTLSPKRISAFVEASKQAIIQSAIPLEAMLRDDLLMGAAVLLEYQALNGPGTGANMTGVRSASGIGTVVGGTNGAAPAWSHFVDLETDCANNNAEPDATAGYVTNTRVRGKLKQTQFGTNLPFIWQPGQFPVNGYRVGITNNMPNNLTKGTSTTVCSAAVFGSDWSMLAIGLFGAPDITVDPYSKADTGQVKITINQFADAGVRLPAAFAKIDDLLAN